MHKGVIHLKRTKNFPKNYHFVPHNTHVRAGEKY